MSQEKEHPLTRAIKSTLAAFIGIQKEENMKKDLEKKDPFIYIITGIVAVMIFVLLLIFVVKQQLNT